MNRSALFSYFAAIIVITIICGLIYVSVQQSYRAGANDPQLQMARDLSERIKDGQSVERHFYTDTIEISQSLALFIVLFDGDGKPVRSTGLLDGQFPQLPKGVFDFVKKNGEDDISWQPRRGIRFALVVKLVESAGSDGIKYVGVGRSLHEVEKRVSNLTTMVMLAWIACMIIIGLHGILKIIRMRRSQNVDMHERK